MPARVTIIVIAIVAIVGTAAARRLRRTPWPERTGTTTLSERCHDLVVEGGSTHGLGGLVATAAGLVLLALVVVPTGVRRTGRRTPDGDPPTGSC